MYKKYKVFNASDLNSLNEFEFIDVFSEARYSVDNTQVILEYANYVDEEDVMTEQEMIDYVKDNYDFWNEDTSDTTNGDNMI